MLKTQDSQHRARETQLEAELSSTKQLHLEQLESKERESIKQLAALQEEEARRSEAAAQQAIACLKVTLHAMQSDIESIERAKQEGEENAKKVSSESLELFEDLKRSHATELAYQVDCKSEAEGEKQAMARR